MTDIDQYRKAAKARGACEIDYDAPTQGFRDDEPVQSEEQLGPELSKQVEEFEDRVRNLKAPSSADELAAEYREGTEDSTRVGKLPFQKDLEEWHPGKIMRMEEFLRRLQMINPTFFLAEESHLCMRGIGLVVGGEAVYSGVACQDRIMPEWTQLKVDRFGVATSERKRGWRACLLGLIYRGHVTLHECDLIFGPAENSPRSRPWYRMLYSIRNGKCPECKNELCTCKGHWDYLRADNYQYQVPEEMKQGKRQIVENRNDSPIWTP